VEVKIRRGDWFAIRRAVLDRYDTLGIYGSRERIEDQGSQPTEDGSVRSDADGNGKNRHGREGWTVAKSPQRISEVL
jgi:hypothetical protein